eukprot:3510915-Amphidinium_carterae.1
METVGGVDFAKLWIGIEGMLARAGRTCGVACSACSHSAGCDAYFQLRALRALWGRALESCRGAHLDSKGWSVRIASVAAHVYNVHLGSLRGLFGFIQNDAYVLHDRLIHNVNLSVASFTEPLGGEDGDDTSLRAIAILPAEVGQVRSAAFTAWGGLAVVVASDTNISSASVLQLCWQPASLAQL